MHEFFETIRIEDGEVRNIEWHQKRCERTLAHFGSKERLDLAGAIEPPESKGLFRCKVVYTPQKIVDVFYYPYRKRSVRSLKLVEANELEYSFKYLDRSGIDALFAKRGECDEIVMIKNGLLADTSIANIAFFDGKRWLTPAKPLLEGTTRARYIEEKKLTPAEIRPDMLHSFSKIALLNAMIDFDIMPIRDLKKDKILC